MQRDDRQGDRESGADGARLISESIVPLAGTFDPDAMSRGEPGLPSGFRWRAREYRVGTCLRAWKVVRPESGSGQRYVRRHHYLLRMDNGSLWEIYLMRQPGCAGNPKRRWFLFRIL